MSPFSEFADNYLSNDNLQHCPNCEQTTARSEWVKNARCPCCEALIYDAVGKDECEHFHSNDRGILDYDGNVLLKLGC
ncbi:hypothetical protein A5888_002822 [Enterococcus sp. 9E7_DIV0242]|uniref:Uncharacterized protein n=1 Tax=Candidatus Enterococcus clewellii TaxID=1834193 RepID=A0A242K8Q4_9ENTE|nr:hypothetical protein A5888_001585 [Enterococcus sp. 9E7_DIV0242]